MTDINTQEYMPLSVVAKKVGLTPQRVNQMKNAGLVRTKNPFNVKCGVLYCVSDVLKHIKKPRKNKVK